MYNRDELTTEEALNVAEQMGREKVFQVVLTGGEPMLRQDYFVIASSLYEHKIHYPWS